MIYTYQHNGQTYTVTLEAQPDGSYQAEIARRSYRVEANSLPNGGWRLALHTSEGVEAAQLYIESQAEKRYISLNGQDYTLTIPDQRSGRRKTSAGGGDLTAQMPGQVVNILVAEGDTVERGQTLLVLEAMKMEIRVAAPAPGRVKRLLTEKGQIVERGQRLIEIEAAENHEFKS